MTYAFPHNTVVVDKDGGVIEHHRGMELRDYFAAKAMGGILYERLKPVETAKHAYQVADAMLKAREKK